MCNYLSVSVSSDVTRNKNPSVSNLKTELHLALGYFVTLRSSGNWCCRTYNTSSIYPFHLCIAESLYVFVCRCGVLEIRSICKGHKININLSMTIWRTSVSVYLSPDPPHKSRNITHSLHVPGSQTGLFTFHQKHSTINWVGGQGRERAMRTLLGPVSSDRVHMSDWRTEY